MPDDKKSDEPPADPDYEPFHPPDLIPKSVEELTTAPFDPRFPNQNQTRYCYQSFIDYYRCRRIRGDYYEPCQYFYRVYKSMCPNDWTREWRNQIKEGVFPGNI